MKQVMRKAGKTLKLGIVAGAMLAALGAASNAAAWKPQRPVEVINPAGAGGASDQMARLIMSIVQKHQLMKQPMIIQIKSGSSGAEGAMDVQEAKGNPHKMLIAFSLIYTLPMGAGLPFDWRKMNPVAMIALDEFLLWTQVDTPVKTPKEFVEFAKKQPPETLKIGGTGTKREDHLISFALGKAAGTKFTYIP